MNVQNLIIGSIAIIVVGSVGYKGINVIKQNHSYITTNGLSDRYVMSDSAIWNIRIEAEGKDIKEAQEKVTADTAAVLKFLTNEGIKSEEIAGQDSTGTKDRYRWNEYSDKKVPRFSISNTITIKSQRLEKMEHIKSKTNSLLEKGINIENTFRYFYKDIAKLRIEMIKEATLDSQERAKNIAETLGAKITGLRNLYTGRFAIYAEDVAVTQDWADGWKEEASKKKRIRIIVTGTYNLKS